MSNTILKEKRKYASQYYADKYYEEYNYEDYSQTANFKAISCMEVGCLKKIKWEWKSPAPINGKYVYSKKIIKKYIIHDLTKSNY